MGAISYNIKSSKELGWKPEWFGATGFDEDLINKIKKFQKEHRISDDGYCGYKETYRRIYADQIAKLDNDEPNPGDTNRKLIYGGNEIDINWPKVVRWIDDDGLRLDKYPALRVKRDIKTFVTHWDVCLSSKSCISVLNKRGLSVHFCIDNDGTIFQLADIETVCYHAGSRKWNESSIGVEVSNAFYPKYQATYKRRGFGERPIVKGATVHGRKVEEFTDFYDVQIKALSALYAAINKHVGLPLKTPLDKYGNTSKVVSKEAEADTFRGFVSHYHLTRRKMDCCNLEIESILSKIR